MHFESLKHRATVQGVLNWLVDNWNQPEEGISKTRGGRQNLTYGRLMSWVAFDRCIRLADRHGAQRLRRPGSVSMSCEAL